MHVFMCLIQFQTFDNNDMHKCFENTYTPDMWYKLSTNTIA